MADFQQGIIALLIIIIVSVWGVLAAGGPQEIFNRLNSYNSTAEWKTPNINTSAIIRIKDPDSGKILVKSQKFLISENISDEKIHKDELKIHNIIKTKNSDIELKILFPKNNDILRSNYGYKIVWASGRTGDHVNIDYSIDNEKSWSKIAVNHFDGQAWRLDLFSFTGTFEGQFPIAWFITMMIIALIGGFGMGTSIDWYPEAQRIQSAKSVRDASYSIWAGSALVLIRNAIWAGAIIGFFVIYPGLGNSSSYEMAWYKIGFDYLPVGLVGFLFAGVLAIHLSTVSTHLNLGAMYATRDFYHHYINPEADENKLVNIGRLATFILLLGSFIFGMIIGEEITSWLIFALWIMAAGVWLPNILQVIWWRFNSWGYLSAWIANLGLSWLIVWILPSFGIIPDLPDYLQFWTLIFLNALVYLPVTYLTKPENMDHLVEYYVMCRPIGFWKPVKNEAIRKGLIKK